MLPKKIKCSSRNIFVDIVCSLYLKFCTCKYKVKIYMYITLLSFLHFWKINSRSSKVITILVCYVHWGWIGHIDIKGHCLLVIAIGLIWSLWLWFMKFKCCSSPNTDFKYIRAKIFFFFSILWMRGLNIASDHTNTFLKLNYTMVVAKQDSTSQNR